MPRHWFYGDPAAWWPLISPAEEYLEEAAYAAGLLRSAAIPVREVLGLRSGGGHNAVHLMRSFVKTLTDLSAEMLEVLRRLNPECEHHQGDMRTLRLGRSFDAVFVHDAVDYVTNEADLRQAIDTAFTHCRSGGVAVFIPDTIVGSFEASTDHGGTDGADGRGVRYLEWSWDPDPTDTWTVTEYAFLLRDHDGAVSLVHTSNTAPGSSAATCGSSSSARPGSTRAIGLKKRPNTAPLATYSPVGGRALEPD